MLNKPNRIYELRKKAGLSQEALGEELGCNKSKISKID
jgi:transcriptional regulator with XRE-family HTH domain